MSVLLVGAARAALEARELEADLVGVGGASACVGVDAVGVAARRRQPSSDITPDSELTSDVFGRLAPGVRRSTPNTESAAPTASFADVCADTRSAFGGTTARGVAGRGETDGDRRRHRRSAGRRDGEVGQRLFAAVRSEPAAGPTPERRRGRPAPRGAGPAQPAAASTPVLRLTAASAVAPRSRQSAGATSGGADVSGADTSGPTGCRARDGLETARRDLRVGRMSNDGGRSGGAGAATAPAEAAGTRVGCSCDRVGDGTRKRPGVRSESAASPNQRPQLANSSTSSSAPGTTAPVGRSTVATVPLDSPWASSTTTPWRAARRPTT